MSIGDLDGDSAIGGMRRGLGSGIIYSGTQYHYFKIFNRIKILYFQKKFSRNSIFYSMENFIIFCKKKF